MRQMMEVKGGRIMAIPSSLSLVQLHSGQIKSSSLRIDLKLFVLVDAGEIPVVDLHYYSCGGKGKKAKGWYVAPTYQMARQILWDDLQEFCLVSGLGKRTTPR